MLTDMVDDVMTFDALYLALARAQARENIARRSRR